MTDFAKSSKLGTDISNVLISGVSMEKLDTEALNKYAGWLAVTVVVRNQVTGGDLTNFRRNGQNRCFFRDVTL